MIPALEPFDDDNRRLKEAVHPDDWQNPKPQKRYNMVVVGGGTAGLVTAAISAGLGAKTALIEKELLGGDCLNVGCVPSKALISSARVAELARHMHEFGVQPDENSRVNFASVMSRMRKLRADISPHDSVERFSSLGIDVFLGAASFQSKNEIAVGNQTLNFKRACIATGAKAFVPPIPGLGEINYLTNETVFSLTQLPKKMAVIGGGPIGCELAQCFRRFGAEVCIFEKGNRILPTEDEHAATLVRDALTKDGVEILESTSIQQIDSKNESKRILFSSPQYSVTSVDVDEILVATGRQPNTKGLGLEQAGIQYDNRGIIADNHLRTTNRQVFAAGDVTHHIKFTHAADFMARAVVQNALFPWPKKKFDRLTIPHAIFTSPEIAQVGMTEHQLAQKESPSHFDVHQLEFADNDRAIVDGQTGGFVKVLTRKGKDKILGATIVGSKASELIGYFSMAMTNNLGLSKMGSTIFPYPTHAEVVRKFGDLFNKSKLTPFKKNILQKWFGK